MAIRLSSATLFGFAGFGAALTIAGLSWSELTATRAVPEATVDIARTRDPLSGLVPLPELPASRIAIEAGILTTEPTTFAAFYSGSLPPESFTLRPALSERDATSQFAAPGLLAGAATTEVTTLRPVMAMPPPRPLLDTAATAADPTLAALSVLPPARPKLGAIKLASIDPSAPIGRIPDVVGDAAAPVEPQKPAGFGGLFGSWARQDLQVSPSTTPDYKDTGRSQRGMASWYGPGFHGRKTANGERFDQMAMTAAHRTLPFGTKVRVVDEDTGQSVVVRINDRGPFAHGRIIDLSKGSAQALGIGGRGVMRVKVVGVSE